MNLNKNGVQFLVDVKNNLNTLHDIVDICRKKRQSKDTQIKILASCFLSILYEISYYFDHIEEYLEKQLGVSTEKEWSIIKTKIFAESIDNILSNAIPNFESIVVAVTDRWDAYDKENGEELFDKFMKGAM